MASIGLIIGEFVIASLVCGYLLWYYRSPYVSADVCFSVYIAWVFGLASVMLLPYDLSLVLVDAWVTPDQLTTLWKLIYWITFLLAWVILTLQMEYHNSGHFSFRGRMFDSLSKNFLMGFIAAGSASLYIIIMVAAGEGSFENIVGFMMAAGNTYGILLITILMGNGLVSLPRRLWQMADYDTELIRLYILAPTIEANYHDARYELEDCEMEVANNARFADVRYVTTSVTSISSKITTDMSTKYRGAGESDASFYIRIILGRMSNFDFAERSLTRQVLANRTNDRGNATQISDEPEPSALVTLHGRLINAQTRMRAADRRWKSIISSVIHTGTPTLYYTVPRHH